MRGMWLPDATTRKLWKEGALNTAVSIWTYHTKVLNSSWKKLPSMYMQYKEFAGVDITKEKMEVAPTTHYHMGGIRVDPITNMTNVDGLFASGEAACGVHGANRLGGNSLIDLLVFGRRSGRSAAQFCSENSIHDVSDTEIEEEIARVTKFVERKDPVNPYPIMNRNPPKAMTTSEGIGSSAPSRSMRPKMPE